MQKEEKVLEKKYMYLSNEMEETSDNSKIWR